MRIAMLCVFHLVLLAIINIFHENATVLVHGPLASQKLTCIQHRYTPKRIIGGSGLYGSIKI